MVSDMLKYKMWKDTDIPLYQFIVAIMVLALLIDLGKFLGFKVMVFTSYLLMSIFFGATFMTFAFTGLGFLQKWREEAYEENLYRIKHERGISNRK